MKQQLLPIFFIMLILLVFTPYFLSDIHLPIFTTHPALQEPITDLMLGIELMFTIFFFVEAVKR